MTPSVAKLKALASVRRRETNALCSRYCECIGTTSVTIIVQWEHCELDNGSHTSFAVFKCGRCGKLSGFPHENMLLAAQRGTNDTKGILGELAAKHGRPSTGPFQSLRRFIHALRRIYSEISMAI